MGVTHQLAWELGAWHLQWSPAGLEAVGWPQPGDTASVAGGGEPPWARGLRARLARHVAGRPQSYDDVVLDDARLPDFHRRVYRALRQVPAGRTVTYAELAALAGSPGAVRAVGQALARNPYPLVVPCHRVVAASGAGGFTAPGGLETKARLLAAEGVLLPVGPQPELDGAAAERHLRRVDPVLAKVVARVGACRPGAGERAASPYASLARSILYQQLNGKAAATIHARVLALMPGRRLEPGALLALPPGRLREAGVSASKAAALVDLSERALSGQVPPWNVLARVPDAHIVSHLSRVRGVGAWTVQMMLLFELRRPDVLPVDDFAVAKAFAALYGVAGDVKGHLRAHAEAWRPYRSAAAWYLWQSLG